MVFTQIYSHSWWIIFLAYHLVLEFNIKKVNVLRPDVT